MRCARGPDLPGLTRAGGMAELFKTRSRAIVKLVAGAEPAEVAALADAGLTAHHAVGKAVPALGAGSSAVVVGVGGLGHIGIQCLKAMTMAQVIAVDISEEALDVSQPFGRPISSQEASHGHAAHRASDHGLRYLESRIRPVRGGAPEIRGSAATASYVRSMTPTMSSSTWTSRPPARRRNSWASCRPRCGLPRRTPLPSPAPRRRESSNPLTS
jgi:hypothetical protein